MIDRPFWRERIENGWRQAPIVWLAGVRRCGKTTLAQSLEDGRFLYVNCDLPVTVERVRDPELFYRNCEHSIIVFDEIHQLPDPSRVLKIGADLFPRLKILATGSSSLSANLKFRDTLTGRKRVVHLTPVLLDELEVFGHIPLQKRLHHGGLPPALLAAQKEAGFYREWADSFFARDIQKLFGFRDVNKFNALFEYVMKQSGGQVEIAKTASSLGISRPTVESHLRAMEAAQALSLIHPFHGGGQKEVIRMPKGYAFDTGFVSFFRGWDPLRPDDYGILWEHVVLEFLVAHAPDQPIRYWRDAVGREIDFILPRNRNRVDAIECKWNPTDFDPSTLRLFRSYYPHGCNYVVSPVTSSYQRRNGNLEFTVCNPAGWLKAQHLASPPP